MAINAKKMRTRLEARHIALQHEIAAILDEEASLEQSSPGVEDMKETVRIPHEVRPRIYQ